MSTNPARSRVRLWLALAVSLLAVSAGCSSKGTVSGKVLFQGKPLTGGMVQIINAKTGSLSSPIGEDGSYQFTDVPAGEVKVSVTGPAPEPEGRDLPPGLDMAKIRESNPGVSDEGIMSKMGMRPPSRGKSRAVAVSLPEKYSNPDESGLTFTVTGGSQTHDITLE
jgi:hypothetical protein